MTPQDYAAIAAIVGSFTAPLGLYLRRIRQNDLRHLDKRLDLLERLMMHHLEQHLARRPQTYRGRTRNTSDLDPPTPADLPYNLDDE